MGIIMAKGLILEGANVKAMVELKHYKCSITENADKFLEDFNIPLKLAYMATDIKGKDRVEGAVIAKVDKDNIPIKGSEEYIACDTILTSVGFLPESELLMKAGAAVSVLNDSISKVSSERSKLGALQNRLEHTINNLGTSSENLTASESRIRDVDMAKEMMEFTKNNILTQAAQAMLAQANQQPQGVLQLLR
jgi:flagellin